MTNGEIDEYTTRRLESAMAIGFAVEALRLLLAGVEDCTTAPRIIGELGGREYAQRVVEHLREMARRIRIETGGES